jgi:uncharacterized protein YgbK (DUF1537 family)
LQTEHEAGKRLVVVDAVRDEDLMEIGAAADGLPLLTGGSGAALGLPANFARRGLISDHHMTWQCEGGPCVVLSGSCSIATRAQVALHLKSNPGIEIVAADVIVGRVKADAIADFLLQADGVPIAYSSSDPEIVKQVQTEFGRERSAQALESFFAEVARACIAGGVTRLITAGGETSGAVVEGLHLDMLETGPEIDPGVPALRAGSRLVIALKSGNFGAPDFFAKAALVLKGDCA